jgi:hypothetical protein
MCFFMSIIFILIQIKFDIDINNDELKEIIWEHKKREQQNWLSLIVHTNVELKFDANIDETKPNLKLDPTSNILETCLVNWNIY